MYVINQQININYQTVLSFNVNNYEITKEEINSIIIMN